MPLVAWSVEQTNFGKYLTKGICNLQTILRRVRCTAPAVFPAPRVRATALVPRLAVRDDLFAGDVPCVEDPDALSGIVVQFHYR